MIDLHTHIIPAVDDGAESMDIAIQMVKMAQEDGIKSIVATPHINSASSKITNFSLIINNFKDLKTRLKFKKIELNLYLGAEVYFDEFILDNLSKYKEFLTINNSKYFILEFPMNFIYPGSNRFIKDLVGAGFVPIISHPERNLQIQRNPTLLYELLTIGCLTQINGGSLRGDFGSTAMHTGFNLLKKNWVHIIASDGHDLLERKPILAYLFNLQLGIQRDKLVQLTHSIPQSIINNQEIPKLGPYKNPKSKYSIFSLFSKIGKE